MNQIDATSPPARNVMRRITAAGALISLVLALSVVNFAYVALAAGPTRDVGKLTKIDATTYASRGSFHMTTALVEYPEGVSLRAAFVSWLDPQRDLIPRSFVFPKDLTRKEADAEHAAQMVESQQSAVAAALRELGMPPEPDGALVLSTIEKSPARKALLPGDVIVAVNAAPVTEMTDLSGYLTQREPGEVVTVTIRRDGSLKDVSVETIESSKEPGRAVIGVIVRQNQRLPVNVKIDASNIGGPSAGLMFALAIYDALTPEDLTKGHKIAGTGIIDGDTGAVGAIGAMEQKVIGAARLGADIFIAPADELEEARAAADKDMRVIGVSTLKEAIAALRDL